ncbi:hypothetical protein O181_020905 [Austropuccinia psidii MF-1]|uniref:G-patch domain-containing protein n=1 Tax=Austropuccinia psidii MF-1 TaxID=1389203 RepID=A0A9Q3CDI5_9BASI|nr:hypothetical protein [Austropuccinia psidii MF-1]
MVPRGHKTSVREVQGAGSEESFVKIGTPLPPLTSTKADKNEFVPIWKQEVKDEQGRRRLHGAFTGGFSAGYFNTVGSKEGWTPSEFKSSRSDKKPQDRSSSNDQRKVYGQRPEDFMDEEDLAELEQNKELQTNSMFGSTSNKSALLPSKEYDPLTGQVETGSISDSFQRLAGSSRADHALDDVIMPSSERAGHKIMQKMGWRQGQGIGPRIPHERKAWLASEFGLPLESDAQAEEDLERKKHLYAPPDRPLTAVVPWSNYSGLGYLQTPASHSSNDQGFSATSATSPSVVNIQGRKIPQGSSFGLGALNDVEEDDEDVYVSSKDYLTNDPRARRLMALNETKNPPRQTSNFLNTQNAHASTANGKNVFEDNTPLPKGFLLPLSLKKNPTVRSFLPPEVPATWKPDPTRIWGHLKPPSQSEGGLHGRSINAYDRARLLGEKAPPKSVFDYISAKDRARLERAKEAGLASSKPSQRDAEAKTVIPTEALVVVPKLDPAIAQAALRGFIPFSHDPPKQQRYKLYLQSQAGLLADGIQFMPKPRADQTVEIINKELDGFAQSAMMFKPMSVMMASRFTSAASVAAGGEMATPEPGLRQPVFEEEKPEEQPVKEDKVQVETVEISQAAKAVRMDLFGMMTRSVIEFYPQHLLCKRFNVPNPFPQGPPLEAKPKIATNNWSDFLVSHGFQPTISPMDTGKSAQENQDAKENEWLKKQVDHGGVQSLNQVGLASDETQGRDILTSTRPSIDLFKAIFANDDDSDTEDDADECSNQNIHLGQTSNVSREHMGSDLASKDALESKTPLIPIFVDPKAVENLAAFRPTFKRKGRVEDDAMAAKPGPESFSKKSKKKTKRPTLMSFEDDLSEEVGSMPNTKKKKNKAAVLNDKQPESTSTQTTHVEKERIHGRANASQQPQDDKLQKAIPPDSFSHLSDAQNLACHDVTSKANKKVQRLKAIDLMD